MKNKVVVFTENNARVLINPPDLEGYRSNPKALVNPDLSRVKNLEPHFWKLAEGEIHPMAQHEKNARALHIQTHGVHDGQKYHDYRPERVIEKEVPKYIERVVTKTVEVPKEITKVITKTVTVQTANWWLIGLFAAALAFALYKEFLCQ